MTDEELAEIDKHTECGQMDMDEDEALSAIRDLLAEVKRLRAFKDEAMDILRIVGNAERLEKHKAEAWKLAGDLLDLYRNEE